MKAKTRVIDLLPHQCYVISQTCRLYAKLTPIEGQIATLAADGLADKQIAERLGISHRTVNNHIQNITPKARHIYANNTMSFRAHIVPRLYCVQFLIGGYSYLASSEVGTLHPIQGTTVCIHPFITES